MSALAAGIGVGLNNAPKRGPVPSALSGCVAWWDAYDYVSGALVNKGTAGASANFTVSGPTFSGGEFTFDGINDKLEANDAAWNRPGANESWTIGIICHPQGTLAIGQRIFAKDGGTNGFYNIRLTTGAALVGVFADQVQTANSTGPVVTADKFQCLASVRDCVGNTVISYRNGVAGNTVALTSETSGATAINLMIGCGNNANWFAMKFKAAFLTNVALTPAQLLEIQNFYGIS